jgi:hypothetical protein
MTLRCSWLAKRAETYLAYFADLKFDLNIFSLGGFGLEEIKFFEA